MTYVLLILYKAVPIDIAKISIAVPLKLTQADLCRIATFLVQINSAVSYGRHIDVDLVTAHAKACYLSFPFAFVERIGRYLWPVSRR